MITPGHMKATPSGRVQLRQRAPGCAAAEALLPPRKVVGGAVWARPVACIVTRAVSSIAPSESARESGYARSHAPIITRQSTGLKQRKQISPLLQPALLRHVHPPRLYILAGIAMVAASKP